MADFVKGLFGGPKSAAPSSTGDDADFADFAGAPAPSPASVFAATASQGELPAVPTSGSPVVPYTKWYRVWERTTPRDFYQEALVLPFIIVLVGLHVWGRRKNKRKARGWIAAHAPILEKEFSVVGFGGRKAPTIDDVQQSGLAKATNKATVPDELLKEKTAQEYTTYATGRQNVASVDAKLSLFKRYNPLTLILEWSLSIFFDSMRAPVERMEMTAYAFDGKEKDLIPVPNKRERENLESRIRGLQSSYDGFVWAVVHKDEMRHLREDRYDISLTSTKDNAKLPPWAIVMSESAEITNLLLTNELITLLNKVGERTFDYLIVTDQPLTKPQKLDETVPRKRLCLSLRLPSDTSSNAYESTTPLVSYFLRLPDLLVSSAHFRPEVTRKIKTTREEESKKLKKLDEEEKAEERKLENDRKKKADREARLKGMSADEQRKFLEKERKEDNKKQTKRMTKRA